MLGFLDTWTFPRFDEQCFYFYDGEVSLVEYLQLCVRHVPEKEEMVSISC